MVDVDVLVGCAVGGEYFYFWLADAVFVGVVFDEVVDGENVLWFGNIVNHSELLSMGCSLRHMTLYSGNLPGLEPIFVYRFCLLR